MVSSLLGLIGIDADPIKSKEHILLSTIINNAWLKGEDLDIASLIQEVQKPSFSKIGVIDINTFFPQKERIELSVKLNSLLASPGFHAWMEGEPLDIQDLLYTDSGKPKISILSIAHLSDSERMFFVTLFLNELVSWTRRQSGTSSLRALFYMDEIFGFFPPTAAPPSKLPMLTLLKQARAFGLGVVLCTQNPVDLDYKGLSNCGTWFIGKLQTERDKARVLEGLTTASNGNLDSASLDKLISLTKKRVFIMRTIYEDKPVLFETRWSMSYLRGPLTTAQIAKIEGKGKVDVPAAKQKVEEPVISSQAAKNKPAIPPGVSEYFINVEDYGRGVNYAPKVLGLAKLHFVDTKSKIDIWRTICMVQDVDDDGVDWDGAEQVPMTKDLLTTSPIPGSTFNDLPSLLFQQKTYGEFEKSFAAYLYRDQTLDVYTSKDASLISNEGETKQEFSARASLAIREKRDTLIAKVKDKYATKLAALADKMRRAEGKVSEQKQQAQIQKAETWISFGTTVLGAILGRGVTKGTISQTGTSMRRAGRMTKESEDVARAEDTYASYKRQYDEMEQQVQNEIDHLLIGPNADGVQIETVTLRPKKTDIQVDKVALVWVPKRSG